MKRTIVGLAAVTVVSYALELLIPLIQRSIIDQITDFTLLTGSAVFALLSAAILSICMAVFDALAETSLKLNMQNKIQRELLESATRLQNKTLKTRGPGAFMVNIFGDSEQLSDLVNSDIFATVLTSVASLIILVIVSQWTWVFAMIALPTAALILILTRFMNKLYMKHLEAFRENVLTVNPRVLEYLENRNALLGYSDIRKYEDTIYREFDTRDKELLSAVRMQTVSSSLVGTVRSAALILFFVFAVFEIKAGRLSFAEFIACTAYFPQFFAPVAMYQSATLGMKRFRMIKEKLSGSLDATPEIMLPTDGGMRLRDCMFTYKGNREGTREQTIEKLSLDIDGLIGVVGVSGEGKTTLLRIIMGELEPDEGVCLLGSQNVSKISKQILFASLKLISQEPEVFAADLIQNIVLGKTALSEDEYAAQTERYKDALKPLLTGFFNGASIGGVSGEEENMIKDIFLLSSEQLAKHENFNILCESVSSHNDYAAELLASILTARKFYIKEKLDALLDELELKSLSGRSFGRKGCEISGGEKNRICLARTLLPENQGYFIIDEPFVNLDALSERKCLEALRKHTEDSKGIVISHKLHVLRELTNDIIVLNQGAIEARGSHAQLMSISPLYKRLIDESDKQSSVYTA
ncbi:MAG: ABC transporter ATP-binding protein/permease [Oscillospiraceae bacterium]|nr:ABC transporter ATP-binding protein/permease [Oscillospiraceae bacterium]